MVLESRYNPQTVEEKWYKHWLDNRYFHSEPDDREAYSIVIPPPNVTGVLHMGHMLNNTIQDLLIRKARLTGKNACWVPGMDHASIATEAKVVRKLRDEGIKKSDLTREQFLEYAWKWKEEYGGIILKQLRKLGASCDWERTAFTMDEDRSKAVLKAFVDLYKAGKLYRGLRMVNWDPQAQTVLSNEEVIYSEEQDKLYYVKYQIKGSADFLTIATTRPETIMGDTAVAVHPEDSRYQKLKGATVIVPIVNREVPIVFDEYVDREFGTGALKITPSHDVNDYEIGKKHNLDNIDILNPDGTLSKAAEVYVGIDREEARKLVAKDLDQIGILLKVEDYTHNVGRSERTGVVVEPRLSLQWYVDMKSLVKPALEAVENDTVEFFPKNQKNTYRHWMENIRDWCISRQLWWGHRIPAWYIENEVLVAETAMEALDMARKRLNNPELKIEDLRQDEDVLDTWFSSWLWPISVFNGFESQEEIDYYYPTSVLVTGWDIIFLWVARMIMAGYEWKNSKPFDHVYFTGMVRDKQRRKMSKSLGNSPDALALIDDFGADGVRFGMMMSSPAGGDLLFDEKLCEQGRNFCNKIWNALRLIKGWDTQQTQASEKDRLALRWINQKLNKVLKDAEKSFAEYRVSESLMATYSFVWTDFCSWFLEMIKPNYGDKISKEVYDGAIKVFEKITTLLHPFMPFITEEIWHHLKDRETGDDCIISQYPLAGEVDQHFLHGIELAKQIVTNVRDIRNREGIKMAESLPLVAKHSKEIDYLLSIPGYREMVMKMANLQSLEQMEKSIKGISFICGKEKLILQAESSVNVEKVKEETLNELAYQQGFVKSIMRKLENEKFVNNAPAQVVERERKKLSDGNERIKILQEKLDSL